MAGGSGLLGSVVNYIIVGGLLLFLVGFAVWKISTLFKSQTGQNIKAVYNMTRSQVKRGKVKRIEPVNEVKDTKYEYK